MKVKIGGIPYKVKVLEMEKGYYGKINYSDRTILLNGKQPPERILKTFFHELLHGIIEEYKIADLMDIKDGAEEHHEHTIDQLSMALMESLTDIGFEINSLSQ